jgi:hypothetical protein
MIVESEKANEKEWNNAIVEAVVRGTIFQISGRVD